MSYQIKVFNTHSSKNLTVKYGTQSYTLDHGNDTGYFDISGSFGTLIVSKSGSTDATGQFRFGKYRVDGVDKYWFQFYHNSVNHSTGERDDPGNSIVKGELTISDFNSGVLIIGAVNIILPGDPSE